MNSFTTITSALSWLETPKNNQPRQNLERLRHALNYLGNPQHQFPIIHLTGTNGKGTVSAFLKRLLMSQHLKVGTFTSPHIMRFNERLALNDMPIPDEELIALTNEMLTLNQYMRTTTFGQLAGFELYTAMACVYFARQKCDVCLIEVGIGGLGDCTNVLDGKVAVITTIGLDHVDKLGNTLSDIAYQKAGIIKRQATVITGAIAEEAMTVIRRQIAQQSAKLYAYHQDFTVTEVALSPHGARFHYNGRTFKSQMLGAHQVDNACVALRAFEAWMQQTGHAINWESATDALQHTHWPARMEKMSDTPLIYIDGAHNQAGLLALRQMLATLFADYELTLLYSGLSTKDQRQQLATLDTFGAKELVLTEFQHKDAMPVSQFESVANSLSEWQTNWQLHNDWRLFIEQYTQREKGNDKALLVVTGSLYFVSAVRQYFMK